jgi:hypothetical protein
VDPFEPISTSYSREKPSRYASRRSVFGTRMASSLYTGSPMVNGVIA